MNQVTSSTFLIIFLALSVIPSSTFFGIESVRASADIENIDWTLVSYGNQNNPTAVLPITPNDITASFSGGSITGSSGCNSYFGSYTILGNSLTITIEGTTLMACNPPEVMTQENTYISALEAAQSYQLMGNKLKIFYIGGVLTFTTNQLPPLPPFDFSINLLPLSITVEAGQPANFQISLTYSDIAYSGTTVNIQVSGLGPGMTYQLTAQGGLIIQTLPSTPSGTYPMIIIGSAQGKTHQTSGIIIVTTKAPTTTQTPTITVTTPTLTPTSTGDFTLTPSPIELTILPGETASFSLIVDKIGEFSDSVAFIGVNGYPSDTGFDLRPEEGFPRFAAALKIDTNEYTQPGTYLILVQASGGGKTHSETLTLIIKELTPVTSISTEIETETEQKPATDSNMVALLSNPTNLMMIIIALLVIGIIAALMRRGRSPTHVRPQVSGKFCVDCGEPIKAGETFCRSCGKRLE